MATADRHIGDLDVELTKGQGRSIKLTSLLTNTSTTVGQWTAVAGANGSQAPTCTEDSGSLLVSWSDSQATASIGRVWRLRLDGDDVAGGRVVEARPQATPGTASVAIQVDPLSEVTTTVVVTPAGPTGATGATGAPGADGADAVYSDATPAALGVAAPGTADLAAREGHVHPMPTPGEVGADPAGTAAGLVTAHVDDTTAAHDASAVSVDTSMWGLSTDVEAALAEVYADGVDRVTALPELADGIGTTLDLATPGFARFNRSFEYGWQPSPFASTTAKTTLATVTLPSGATTQDRWLRFVVTGLFANNSGSNCNLTVTLDHAGGVVSSMTWSTVPTSASQRYWVVRGEMLVVSLAPAFTFLAGTLVGTLSGAPAGTAATFGQRVSPGASVFFTEGASVPLSVSGQMSVNNAATSLSGANIGFEVIG